MTQQIGFLEFEGRRVAYATVGEGPPIVLPAWWVSHLVEDWRRDSFRGWVESFARGRRVVRYDRPGTGLSDRERPAETLTLEYEVALLGALIAELGIERLSLVGISCGGPAAVVYASRSPERVDRLVLYGAYADGSGLAPAGTRTAMVDLVRSHWGLGSRMLADVFRPTALPTERAAYASFQRAAASPEVAADLLELTYAYDVRDVLPTVAAPTLVVHREHDSAISLRNGRELAGLVPGAELVTLPGDAHLPWEGGSEGVVEAISGFFGIAQPEREPVPALEELSAREREVLRLVAEGLSDAEIAARLVLSPHTVHRHVANIRRKLGLRSRSAAAAHAVRAGLIR